MTKPVVTLANIDLNSDIWAVFEDEVSDGGFEYDEDPVNDHRASPNLDRYAAANAVITFDDPGALDPPRPFFRRPSARTSSSSSNRTALTGFLETMGLGGAAGSGRKGATSRASKTSDRSDELRSTANGAAHEERGSGDGERGEASKWLVWAFLYQV